MPGGAADNVCFVAHIQNMHLCASWIYVGTRVVDSSDASVAASDSPDGASHGERGLAGADRLLVEVTGQASVEDAIDWLADGLPLGRDCDARTLIGALAVTSCPSERAEAAARRLARGLASSRLDSADVLFNVDAVAPPSRYAASLERLAERCPTRGLDSLTAEVLIEVQRDDSFAIEALCAVAGISYKDLTGRLDGSAGHSEVGPMSQTQLRAAFKIIDTAVCGFATPHLPGGVQAQPLELLPLLEGISGWQEVERRRTEGVTYGTLLAQRALGGAWLAHRNRTSGSIPKVLAGQLCAELTSRGIRHLRSTAVGGDTAPSVLARLTESDKQVSVVALDAQGSAAIAVVFSAARDHGTARASAGRLLAMERSMDGVPIAVCIAGPGWSKRHETADLALGFAGFLYSDESLDDLVEEIARRVSAGEESGD
jgi:hypothetical protein